MVGYEVERPLLRRADAEGLRSLSHPLRTGKRCPLPTRLLPSPYSWDWSDRRDEAWRRTHDLKWARVKRNMRYCGGDCARVLTLGLWRK